MKKSIFVLTVLGALLVASSAFAQADWADKNGTLGVGVDRHISTDGGALPVGLGLRFYPSETFGAELIVGGSMNSTSSEPDGGDKVTTNSRRIDISLLGEVSVLRSRQAVLSGYAGIGFGLVAQGNQDDSFGYTDFAAELGLRGEVWLYEFFSIHGRVGINIDPIGDKEGDGFPYGENDAVTNGGMNIGIFNGDPMALFGFTFWMS